jgi:hypothetical protein
MSRDELFNEVRRVFEPRYRRNLSEEEVREIVYNLTGFFKVLGVWARVEKSQQQDLSPTESELRIRTQAAPAAEIVCRCVGIANPCPGSGV